MSSPAHLVRWAASLALCYSGTLALVRRLRRLGPPSALVLRYHRVLSQETSGRLYRLGIPDGVFRRQILHLRRHYRIVGLEEVAAIVEGRGGTRGGLVVAVTFDDGYADNLEAARWMAGQGLPVTIFPVSGPMDDGRPFFWERLAAIFDLSPVIGGLSRVEARVRFDRERARIKDLSPEEREDALATLAAGMGVEPDRTARPSDRPLTWEEAAALSRAGVRFGGHTVTHPLLTRLTDAEVRREITEGNTRIGEMLGVTIDTFAYPTGDVDRRVRDLTEATGVRLAVTCAGGRNMRGQDPLLLRRKGVGELVGQGPGGGYSRALWGAEVEGVFDALRGRKRAPGRRRSPLPAGTGD